MKKLDIVIQTRKKLNMSQAELARRVNVSRQFMCEIEKGRKSFSIQTAYSLSHVLSIDIETLIKAIVQRKQRNCNG